MINPVSRKPLAITDYFSFSNNKSWIVIYELNIGPNGDIEINDFNTLAENNDEVNPNIKQFYDEVKYKVEEFSDYVYTSFPKDYTDKPLHLLMLSRAVDGKQLADKFIKELKANYKNAKEVRLLATYRATNLIFSLHFIYDDKEYVNEITTTGFDVTSYFSRPGGNSSVSSFNLGYEVSLPLDYKTLNENKPWYLTQGLTTLNRFIAFCENNVNSYREGLAFIRARDDYMNTNDRSKLIVNNDKINIFELNLSHIFQNSIFEILDERSLVVNTNKSPSSPELVSESLIIEFKYNKGDELGPILHYDVKLGRLQTFKLTNPTDPNETFNSQNFIPIFSFNSNADSKDNYLRHKDNIISVGTSENTDPNQLKLLSNDTSSDQGSNG